MGEAIYTLKATFPNAYAAEKGLKELTDALKDIQGAYVYWQNNRGKAPTEFWPEFKAAYPKATALLLLADVVIGGDCNNELSGKMSCTPWDGPLDIKKTGQLVTYSAEVWHFADWNPLAQYAVNVGATFAKWRSDEGACGEKRS